MHWSWARDVNDRHRDETETSASRDRDVDNFSRDETETHIVGIRLETVSRPRRRDRDHNPADNDRTTVLRLASMTFDRHIFAFYM